jgi:hypothetical protein
MYTVDDLDIVKERKDIPQSSIGAPFPSLLATERLLHLAYYLEESEDALNCASVRIVGEYSEREICALVRFKNAIAHMFGPPNDEAFQGHPLADRGLKPYAVFEVSNSSWIRMLERMNAVHPNHLPKHYTRYRHFVFTFHDTVFECVAESFDVSVHPGSVSRVLRTSWPTDE